ncbi:MAG: RNA polymerase sigma factor [bacterium]|nr:RNA polymerase sigma factor [bacterium]
MVDDQQLVREFLDGDDKAFEQLLKSYLSAVYNFIFQMTRERAVAEDLTQETFIKAWRHLARFDQKKSFKTWLFTIAKNTTYDFFKKKKTLPFSYFEDEEGKNRLDTVSEGTPLPDEILAAAETSKELDQALRKIPEPYRELLLLAYREDFSLQEIAEILATPYNTIKSRHQRALKILKQTILSENASESSLYSY